MVRAKNAQALDDTFPTVEKVLPAAALGLAYGTLSTAYYQYYKPFGLSPEAAGLDTTRMLSDLVIGPVLMGTFLSALCLAIYIGWQRIAGRRTRMRRTQSRSLLRIAVLAASFGMIASGIYITLLARAASDRVVNDGDPVGSVVLDLRLFQVPLLQMPTRHVISVTLNSSAGSAAIPAGDPCLLLIGESAGRSYFYETFQRRLYSFQTDMISYSIDASGAAMETACRPPKGDAKRDR